MYIGRIYPMLLPLVPLRSSPQTSITSRLLFLLFLSPCLSLPLPLPHLHPVLKLPTETKLSFFIHMGVGPSIQAWLTHQKTHP